MILIVAHHYVVNSGLYQHIAETSYSITSDVMLIFGAWGKTGINCFVLITGYFMCKSKISLHKFLKLYFQITFYAIVIYCIFCLTSYQTFSIFEIILKMLPVRSIGDNFVGCFIIFYLLIPFLTILVNNLNKKQHVTLICVLLLYQSILPIAPTFRISFNYVSWFSTLFIIASYIRFYGLLENKTNQFWGFVSILCIIVSASSVVACHYAYRHELVNTFIPYFFISDSNKPLALLTAVSSFMYFKGFKMQYISALNQIGGGAFAVLLIHANSDTMRQWLWKDTVKPIEHFGNLWPTLLYASICVLIVFIVCICIEQIRLALSQNQICRINRWIPIKQ